jgi:hypothetical protein
MLCSGNGAELCGSGNRIQVYQDSTWSIPTTVELLAALESYTEVLSYITNNISQYNSDVAGLQAAEKASPARKRSQTQTEQSFEMAVLKDISAVNNAYETYSNRLYYHMICNIANHQVIDNEIPTWGRLIVIATQPDTGISPVVRKFL